MNNIAQHHNLKNKVIVISGAGGVLCAFLAKALAKTQAKIALLDINLDAANQVAEEINQAGGIAKAYQTNVLDLDSIVQTRNAITQDFGTCDILINGAGAITLKLLPTTNFINLIYPRAPKPFLNWINQASNLYLISTT